MRFKLDPADFSSCPQFNQWVDEGHEDEHGQLEILAYRPRPSEVLFQMSPTTYTAAFSDFLREYDENLKATVVEGFPSPVAHYYYRFEHGYENELQRLHFLRDTWEAMVDVLHALAVGEIRFRGIVLADPMKFDHLLSDRVADRLLNIERIVAAASADGVSLSVGKVALLPVLEKMRELNQTRNAFSHSATLSEAQARTWISECYEDVLGVLDDIRALEKCSLLRYMGQIDGSTLRCETFKGHGFTRTIQPIPLTAGQVLESQRYFQQGQVLAFHDGHLFSVRPLIYFREDVAGHTTKPCVFRKKHGDVPNRRIEFAVVGDSVSIEENRAVFQVEMDELRALFGLGAD
jgi:hypothetical protein